jgi:hypothetical protein
LNYNKLFIRNSSIILQADWQVDLLEQLKTINEIVEIVEIAEIDEINKILLPSIFWCIELTKIDSLCILMNQKQWCVKYYHNWDINT